MKKIENKKEVLVHGSMVYKCENCGELETMYLEKGVEGPNKVQPCPFIICCPKCESLSMNHVMWSLDTFFPPRPIICNESYFALDLEHNCGKPIFKEEEEDENIFRG